MIPIREVIISPTVFAPPVLLVTLLMTSPRNLWIRCNNVCVLVVSERLYQTILRLNYNSSWLYSYDANVRERE
jgi:hypothetical protein